MNNFFIYVGILIIDGVNGGIMGELDNKNGDTSCIGVTADMGDNAGGKIGGPFIGINGKSFCKSHHENPKKKPIDSIASRNYLGCDCNT